MSFLIRGIEMDDLDRLYELAKQFVLLNLPADRMVLKNKIERSVAAFNGELEKPEAEYLFAAVDLNDNRLAGTSQILAKHGTPEEPHLFFRVLQKDRMSNDLGVGFIHKVLRFKEDTDGPTEIGGLLVDSSYRGRPEKIGKQISMVRFLFMGMEPARFEERVLCELTPPLTDEGRSEFWEALGRRFTGMPYQEADHLSHVNKEFIRSLFPEEDIYLSLLDSKARLVMGRVGESTRPAQHLLEGIGFEYLNEVDPFDGGPHYGANLDAITVIQKLQKLKVKTDEKCGYDQQRLIGKFAEGKFAAMQAFVCVNDDDTVSLPENVMKELNVKTGQEVSVMPLA